MNASTYMSGSPCTSLPTGASFGVQCQLRYVSSSRFSSNVGTRDHPLLLLLRNLQLILQAAGTDTSTGGAEPSHDIIQINHHVPSCRHPSTRSMSARVSSSLSASYVASVACSARRPLHRDTLSDSSDLPAPGSFEARCEALRRSLPSSPSQINEHSSNQNRSNMQMGPPTMYTIPVSNDDSTQHTCPATIMCKEDRSYERLSVVRH